MFKLEAEIAPPRMSEVLSAAERAIRAIPPAFPLEATVAVNPYLGQTGEDLATASARLRRVAGIRATQSRKDFAASIENGRIADEDLQDALAASHSTHRPADLDALKAFVGTERATIRPLPTVADLAAAHSGIDWPSIIEKTFGHWAAGQFDMGQALWRPDPAADIYAAWRAWATNDLTPEIAGLTGFCAHVAAAPDTAEHALHRATEALGLNDDATETAFHRLLIDLGGWSQHARWLLWQAELNGGTDRAVADLLAIRLVWEEALLAQYGEIAEAWAEAAERHAEPVEPNADDVALAILQDAADRAHQRGLIAALDGPAEGRDRPEMQAAFCIDVRSEVYRRALESLDAKIETIGFAGFFGLPLAHKAHASDVVEAHLPVLLTPAVETTSHADEASETGARITARAIRAWGRFRQAAVSSFAFVEAAGPFYGGKLVKDALGVGKAAPKSDPAPKIAGDFSAEQKADTATAVLKAMSLTKGHGRVVLLLGHGGHVANNPHESAYHCGACGGYTGEVSARLLAMLLNDPETRSGLAERGIDLPADTVFVAGLHDTTTDDVTLYDSDLSTAPERLGRIRGWLQLAGRIARDERAGRLPGATHDTIAGRATNWAEVRPEWGLAGCAAFIAGPRAATSGKDLGGRAFLHSYDWQDDDGFGTLELILTAPVVVASWISLQYYGSAISPDVFGGGNKLIHNVSGGIGVIEGNSGRLRPGLPLQSVHDGENLVHEPLRLSVMIEAPIEAITDVLKAHEGVRELFDNGWMHLFALENGQVVSRYRPGLEWESKARVDIAA